MIECGVMNNRSHDGFGAPGPEKRYCDMTEPRFPDDPAFKLLRAGELDAFHDAIKERDTVDYSGCNLRGVDFRHVDLRKFTLRDAYLRDTDLRGCDLRHLDLSGASLHNAKISGTYFPYDISPAELRMSLRHGTRLRIPARPTAD